MPTITVTGVQVSVDTTAGGTRLVAESATRDLLVIRNDGAANLYIGPSGLTSTTAFDTVAPGARATFTADGVGTGDLSAMAEWYGLSASGTLTVNVGSVSH